jgi:hypothetical protein
MLGRYAFALLTALSMAFGAVRAQTLVDCFDITNRLGRAVPIGVAPLVLRNVNVTTLSIRRCDTDAEVPFYVEPWTANTDSTVCWVRVADIPAARSVTLKVFSTSTQTVSKSNGKATFLVFEENIAAASATSERGPYTMWNGTPPSFGTGLIMEARVRVQANGVGYLAYFSNTPTMSQGYLIKHDAVTGSRAPDHWRVDGNEVIRLGDAEYKWNADEWTRYTIRMTRDSSIIQRQSEASRGRFSTIRAQRPDPGWFWTSFGVAQQASTPGAFTAQWVRVRPLLEIELGVTRKGSAITSVPETPVICGSQPAVMTGPAGWAAYKWSNGATTRTISVSTPGTVFLDVSDNNGCTVRLGPYNLVRDQAPNAGRDTIIALCLGRRERLSVPSGFASYRWLISTGNKQSLVARDTNAIVIDSADIYTAIVGTSLGCLDTVLFRVNRTYDTTAIITSETGVYEMCQGDTILLYASPPTGFYQWFVDGVEVPGATNEEFPATRAGVVSVTIRVGDSVNTCLSRATATITETTRSTIEIDTTTNLCEGDTLRLDPGAGFTRFRWFAGEPPVLVDTNRVFKVVNAGTYMLQASVGGLCGDTASVKVTILPSPPVKVVSVSGDTSMCIGQTLQLRADGNVPGVVWNTGDTSRLLTITKPGVYSARVVYPNGCVKVDSINIRNGLERSEIVAVDKQALCSERDSTRLTTVGKFGSYLWSTGQTTDTIWVYSPGTYSVRVRLFECESEGSIIIERADPRGPKSVTFADTTSVCPPDPVIPINVDNGQAIPRLYRITVLEGQFAPVEPGVVVPAQTAGVLSLRYTGDPATPGIFRARIRLFDDCEWSEEHIMWADYGEKRVDVQLRTSQPQLRTGQDLTLALAGGDPSGIRRFRGRDTVWVSLSMSADVLEIVGASATCQTKNIEIDDEAGRVTYVMTSCSDGTTEPFLEQRVRVLVGTSLNATFRIDSVRGNNPCFRMPYVTDDVVLPILPFGCELSTISRDNAPGIILRELNDEDILVDIEPSTHDVTVTTSDIMGRLIATDVVRANDTHRTRRILRAHGWTYVMAMSAAGGKGVAIR